MFRSFNFTDKDLNIFNTEIKDYTPEIIIDSHIHSWEKENIIANFNFEEIKLDKPFKDLGLIDEFKYADLKKYMDIVFPGKEYKGILFGFPLPFIDIEKNNNFLIKDSKIHDYKFLYVILPEENLWQTNKNLNFIKNDSFFGFKPYPDLFKSNKNETSIFDFVNESALDFANENNLFILLHLPRKKGLSDSKNVEEIIKILKKYKKIKIILAHAGRSYCLEDVINKLDALNKFDNLFFDLALPILCCDRWNWSSYLTTDHTLQCPYARPSAIAISSSVNPYSLYTL